MGNRLRIGLAGLLLVAGACSSNDSDRQPDPTTPPDTGKLEPVTADTIRACRALADDRGLADYWHAVNNNLQVDAPTSVAAANAIRGLESYLPMPEVAPTVVAAIKSATDAVAADGTLPVRPTQFQDVITPIVEACRDLDIDMSVR